MGPCHFCKREVDKAEMYCYGCETVICDDCDVSLGAYGHGHTPEDHQTKWEDGHD